MSIDKGSCAMENGCAEKVIEEQRCLPKELFESASHYIDQLKPLLDTDKKAKCIKEFETYIKEMSVEYKSSYYFDKVILAGEIITKMQDEDFKKVATDAIYYILLDDFHENMKGGEKYYDARVSWAEHLFKWGEKPEKDIVANVFLKYIKQKDVSISKSKQYAIDLVNAVDYKNIGIESFKSIIQNMTPFCSITLNFFNYLQGPREVDSVKIWTDVLCSIASDQFVKCEGRKLALRKLSDYQLEYKEDKGIFDQCRKNKICIKEITESLDYVNDCLNSLKRGCSSKCVKDIYDL